MNRILLTATVVVLAAVGVFLHVCYPQTLVPICEEDGLVESLTAVFYLLAAGMFVVANRRFAFRNVWLWGFALLFFLVAGEEISWGQRLFGLQTPAALAAINVQEETTLHNIQGIHGSVRAAALILILGICYAVPLSGRVIAPLGRLYARLRLPVFPLWATGIVTVAILLMAVPRLMFGLIIFELDELGEVFLSVAFLVFGAGVLLPEADPRQTATLSESGGWLGQRPGLAEPDR